MTTAVFVLSKNNVPNCQAGNAHASPTQVPGCVSTKGVACLFFLRVCVYSHCKQCYSATYLWRLNICHMEHLVAV